MVDTRIRARCALQKAVHRPYRVDCRTQSARTLDADKDSRCELGL